MTPILVFFHCRANTGYAIAHLERAFFQVARRIAGSDDAVHFAYPDLSAGPPTTLPAGFPRVLVLQPGSVDREHLDTIEQYVRSHGIQIALGFDQPVRQPVYRALRQGGVRTLVSYWGAPMSSLYSGLRLALKRLDVRLARFGPDHYVFESAAMQRTAVDGRGVAAAHTSVTYLGVDADVFQPAIAPSWYAHDTFGIPRDRRIVYYSGHMEPRKGVAVVLRAAVDLVDRRGVRGVHFLLLGNKPGEEAMYDEVYRGRAAEQHITFGGYRPDVERLIPCAWVGAIASTGWDSFTMSSLEIAACGVPLVVSRLPGLDETVDDGTTGFTFPVGDHGALADRLVQLLDDTALHTRMSLAARARVLARFTRERQIESLAATIRRVDADLAAASA